MGGSTLSLQSTTRYTTLNSHEGIINCLPGVDKKPLVISVMQASVVLGILLSNWVKLNA